MLELSILGVVLLALTVAILHAAGANIAPNPSTLAVGGRRQIYTDQMFNWSTASTTLTQMNAGTSSGVGNYPCKTNGFLEKIIIQVSPQAATSLAQSGYVQLVVTSWTPVNTLICPFTGFGLATAPQPAFGAGEATIYPPIGDGYLRLPVSTALAITGSVIFFYSPVTPNITVTGVFSAT